MITTPTNGKAVDPLTYRREQCADAIRRLLETYNCKLVASPSIDEGKIIARVVARDQF